LIRQLGLPFALVSFGALFLGQTCAPGEIGTTLSPRPDEPAPAQPRLSWRTPPADETRSIVEVTGAEPDALKSLQMPGVTREHWLSFFLVRVVPGAGAASDEGPPLLGSYRVEKGVIKFEPRFPLEPGIRYRAEFDPARLHAVSRALAPRNGAAVQEPPLSTKQVAEFTPANKAPRPSTEVTQVYPTATTVPENLLRFYLYFSAPMSRGEAFRHLRLLDATGRAVDLPFLELDQELWSGDGKRLTLLFDPGRVKRGLKPREEAGPILEAGKSYALVVDGDWPDARGAPLKAGFRRHFRVARPDDTSPDPKDWKLDSPPPRTREPLVVRFPEPLDRALLDRLITVHGATHENVAGTVSTGARETVWQFTPAHPWREGQHFLEIGTELEDLAGNSISRPFEVDVARPISRRITAETCVLPFRVETRPP
jgi:hypothetical protein